MPECGGGIAPTLTRDTAWTFCADGRGDGEDGLALMLEHRRKFGRLFKNRLMCFCGRIVMGRAFSFMVSLAARSRWASANVMGDG